MYATYGPRAACGQRQAKLQPSLLWTFLDNLTMNTNHVIKMYIIYVYTKLELKLLVRYQKLFSFWGSAPVFGEGVLSSLASKRCLFLNSAWDFRLPESWLHDLYSWPWLKIESLSNDACLPTSEDLDCGPSWSAFLNPWSNSFSSLIPETDERCKGVQSAKHVGFGTAWFFFDSLCLLFLFFQILKCLNCFVCVSFRFHYAVSD